MIFSEEKPANSLFSIFNARTGEVEEVPLIVRTESNWKSRLTPEQFVVARKKGTEYAFLGKYHAWKEKRIYVCVSCGTDLFDSVTKFDSGNG